MSRTIPTRWPDGEAWLITTLTPVMTPVVVRNVKPELTAPYKCVVVRADSQQRVTPISRYVRVGIQAWSVRTDSTGDLADAHSLASIASQSLEALAPDGAPLIAAEVASGPDRVKDSESGIEYSYVELLMEIHAV